MFGNLSDRLVDTFKNLRSKGKLSPADIDATLREIRRALLEADVNFKVVKEFVAKTKERCMTAEVMESLSPAQKRHPVPNLNELSPTTNCPSTR